MTILLLFFISVIFYDIHHPPTAYLPAFEYQLQRDLRGINFFLQAAPLLQTTPLLYDMPLFLQAPPPIHQSYH